MHDYHVPVGVEVRHPRRFRNFVTLVFHFASFALLFVVLFNPLKVLFRKS
jgi:hypothetical protein